MARKAQRSVSSGAPSIENKLGASLNPLSLTSRERMPYGNWLDPTVALRETPHPSAAWAGRELQPIRPREQG